MRKIKKISLALAIIPIIQTGCMQENSSKITPSKQIDKNITLNSDNNSSGDKNLTKIVEAYNIISNNSNSTIVSPYYEVEEDENSIQNDNVITTITYKESNTTSEYSDNSELATLIDYENPNIEDNNSEDLVVADNWINLSKEDEIIETAKNFLGTKYVWAANGPNAFDCSGFTKYVFKENGITLPRYSGHQAKVGIKVSFDELQKGDLVFFDTEHKFRGKVNHVGIYIGDHKFIHASSAKKKVIITSFDAKPFYKNRFLRGERVINYSSTYASI